MASIFYDPKVFAWGDAITEGISSFNQGKEAQIKELQRQRMYEDLQKDKLIREGMAGIRDNQKKGLYNPTTAPMAGEPDPATMQSSTEEGAFVRPQSATQVAPQRSMLQDVRDVYMGAGSIQNALQADQMIKLEKQINSQEGMQAFETYAKVKKAFGKKPIPEELNNVFHDTFPSFKGIDITKLEQPYSDDPRILKYPIDARHSMLVYPDPETGEKKTQILVEQTEDRSHNTIKEKSEDGKKERFLQYNPQTKRYDIPATEWAPVQSQVPSVNVTTGAPQQTMFIDPSTGSPLIFDKKSGKYKVAEIEGGGTAAPRLTNPSASEREKTATIDVLLDQVNRVKTQYKPEYVGIMSGRAGSLSQLWNKDEAAFRQNIDDIKDSLLRARSGAQINEQEYKRLSKLVPSYADSETQFSGKMESFSTTLNSIKTERSRAQQAGGVFNRGKSTAPQQTNTNGATPRLPGETVGAYLKRTGGR